MIAMAVYVLSYIPYGMTGVQQGIKWFTRSAPFFRFFLFLFSLVYVLSYVAYGMNGVQQGINW